MAESRVEANCSGLLRRDEAGRIVSGQSIAVRVAIDSPAMESSGLHLSDQLLPLTLTGKIDRQLLQEYSRARALAVSLPRGEATI